MFDHGYVGVDPSYRLRVSPGCAASSATATRSTPRPGEVIALPERRPTGRTRTSSSGTSTPYSRLPKGSTIATRREVAAPGDSRIVDERPTNRRRIARNHLSVADGPEVQPSPVPRHHDRRAREQRLLELFGRLVGEVPGDLGNVTGVVGLVGAGGSGVAAEVLPAAGRARGRCRPGRRTSRHSGMASSSSGSSGADGAVTVSAISKASGSIALR